jgi:hypothetical protein
MVNDGWHDFVRPSMCTPGPPHQVGPVGRAHLQNFPLQKKSNAQSTFDQVLRRLSIKGKEHFAFEFEDEQKHSVSLVCA